MNIKTEKNCSKSKILVSACLLKQRVRYDAKIPEFNSNQLDRWITEGRVISFCPEVSAGFSVPRLAAEIQNGSGDRVLNGETKILDSSNHDVTEGFIRGAQQALECCQKHNIHYAVLTEKSPSCGSSIIYDGHFNKAQIKGEGVTTALLRKHGIEVINQFQCDDIEVIELFGIYRVI